MNPLIDKQKDVFYIKTKDGNAFGIYDLELSETDVNKISFGYGSVDEKVDTRGYEDEIQSLVTEVVTTAMKEYMGKGIN